MSDDPLKPLHDAVRSQRSAAEATALLRGWTVAHGSDGKGRKRRLWVDGKGKKHRSTPDACRALGLAPPATPPPKKPRAPRPKASPAPPPPPRTDATDAENELEGRVFEDEGVRWRVREVYFDDDVDAGAVPKPYGAFKMHSGGSRHRRGAGRGYSEGRRRSTAFDKREDEGGVGPRPSRGGSRHRRGAGTWIFRARPNGQRSTATMMERKGVGPKQKGTA